MNCIKISEPFTLDSHNSVSLIGYLYFGVMQRQNIFGKHLMRTLSAKCHQMSPTTRRCYGKTPTVCDQLQLSEASTAAGTIIVDTDDLRYLYSRKPVRSRRDTPKQRRRTPQSFFRSCDIASGSVVWRSRDASTDRIGTAGDRRSHAPGRPATGSGDGRRGASAHCLSMAVIHRPAPLPEPSLCGRKKG